jgi:hypothetical protein
MRPNQKLYIVTRRDLPPGAQAVQGMHALVEFQHYWPNKTQTWHEESNHLCFLAVANEEELRSLCDTLFQARVVYSVFMEPDLGMSLTAIAIEATDRASELVSTLSLALR